MFLKLMAISAFVVTNSRVLEPEICPEETIMVTNFCVSHDLPSAKPRRPMPIGS